MDSFTYEYLWSVNQVVFYQVLNAVSDAVLEENA